MIPVRRFLSVMSCCACLCAAPGAGAADFPERPVRFIVGYAPGGGTDLITRVIGRKLSEKWGQSVAVENRPGADGTIASDVVARAAPDGHTFILVPNSHTVTPITQKLNYDPVKSFAPVTLVSLSPLFVLVNASTGAKSLGELIAAAKATPGKLNYGTSGVGSIGFLIAALLKQMAGIDMVNVSYAGAGPIMPALLRSDIDLTFVPLVGITEMVEAGKIRILAVTSKTRFPRLPNVPTVAEAGNLPGFEAANWYGILAPAGTPRNIIGKLNADMVEAVKSPEIQKTLSDLAFVTVAGTPEEFAQFIVADLAKWAAVLKTPGAK